MVSLDAAQMNGLPNLMDKATTPVNNDVENDTVASSSRRNEFPLATAREGDTLDGSSTTNDVTVNNTNNEVRLDGTDNA